MCPENLGDVLIRKEPLSNEEWVVVLMDLYRKINSVMSLGILEELESFGVMERHGDFPNSNRQEDMPPIEVLLPRFTELNVRGSWLRCEGYYLDVGNLNYAICFIGYTEKADWLLISVICDKKCFRTVKVEVKEYSIEELLEIGIKPVILLRCLYNTIETLKEWHKKRLALIEKREPECLFPVFTKLLTKEKNH